MFVKGGKIFKNFKPVWKISTGLNKLKPKNKFEPLNVYQPLQKLKVGANIT